MHGRVIIGYHVWIPETGNQKADVRCLFCGQHAMQANQRRAEECPAAIRKERLHKAATEPEQLRRRAICLACRKFDRGLGGCHFCKQCERKVRWESLLRIGDCPEGKWLDSECQGRQNE